MEFYLSRCVFVFLFFLMKRTFCFDYYSILACGLADYNERTFDSLKNVSVEICMWAPVLDWPACSPEHWSPPEKCVEHYEEQIYFAFIYNTSSIKG